MIVYIYISYYLDYEAFHNVCTRYQEPSIEVQLSEEIAGSMRLIKVRFDQIELYKLNWNSILV